MDKGIGKKLLWIGLGLSTYCLNAGPRVSLKVMDQQGYPLQEAGVEVPFIIQVESANDKDTDMKTPELVLPPRIKASHRATSNSMRTVNGHTVVTHIHQYSAVADTKGRYTVGPAYVEMGNNKIASDAVVITVARDQKSVTKTRKDVFIKQSVSKTDPFVGEALPYTLRFYYANQAVQLDHLQEPNFKGCKITPLQGPVGGQERIDDTPYQYLEWTATLFPVEEGELVLPTIGAQITVPLQRNHGGMADMFSMVNQMFGHGTKEQMHSNGITLDVKSLPVKDGAVKAIGTFTSFNAKLGSDRVQAGEGGVLTLELVGTGNFMMIGHPALQLPEGLKFYESHAKEQKLTATMSKKDFEYVVQGITSGQYTIPSQRFDYFDVQQGTIKTLQTRPLTFTVVADAKKETTLPEVPKKEVTNVDQNEQIPLEKGVAMGGKYADRCIPWIVFLMLIFLIGTPLYVRSARAMYHAYYERNTVHYQYKNAFKDARNTIKKHRRDKKLEGLYPTIIELFSKRLKIVKSELTEAHIEQALREEGVPEEKIQEWRIFFSRMMSVAFSALPETDDLYDVAEQWVILLEEMV